MPPDNYLEYGIQPRPGRWRRTLLKVLLVLALVVALLGVSCWSILRSFEPRFWRHVSRSSGSFSNLPVDATDINYRRGGAFDPVPWSCDFLTSEASFRTWAKSRGWEPLTTGRVSIWRFDNSEVTIDRGLFYRWQYEDELRLAAYDLTTGRAYYWGCTR
jgi:hypothetical protein